MGISAGTNTWANVYMGGGVDTVGVMGSQVPVITQMKERRGAFTP